MFGSEDNKSNKVDLTSEFDRVHNITELLGAQEELKQSLTETHLLKEKITEIVISFKQKMADTTESAEKLIAAAN